MRKSSQREAEAMLLFLCLSICVYGIIMARALPSPVSPVLSSLPSLPTPHFTVRHMMDGRQRG